MLSVKELGVELNVISKKLKMILKTTGKLEYDEIENVTSDKNDPNEQFYLNEYRGIIDLLNKAYSDLKYLDKPIREEGILSKNKNDRYELGSSNELTSGSQIEFLIYDDFDECEKWIASRIEHTAGDYYIYGYKNVELEGLRVRIRR